MTSHPLALSNLDPFNKNSYFQFGAKETIRGSYYVRHKKLLTKKTHHTSHWSIHYTIWSVHQSKVNTRYILSQPELASHLGILNMAATSAAMGCMGAHWKNAEASKWERAIAIFSTFDSIPCSLIEFVCCH